MENSKTVFTADKTEYADSTKWFHKLYAEGVIDPEVFTQDQSVLFAKGNNKDVPILGAFIGWTPSNNVGGRSADYVAVPPLKGPKGIQLWLAYPPHSFSRSGFAITSACKQVEVAMRWINQAYSIPDAMQWFYGPIGLNVKDDGNNSYELMDAPKGVSAGVFRSSEAPGNTAAAILLKKDVTIKQTSDYAEKFNVYQFYKPYLQKEIYPEIFFSSQDSQDLTSLQTDIYKYVDQMQAKWIVQGGIEGEWDDYVKQLNKMGLDRLIKIYQDNYNRFKNGK
jgi:putative aldouronate transport system substrate-binding protein